MDADRWPCAGSELSPCAGSIPIKSPLQKKHKGDEHPDDDIEITSVNPGGNQQPVSSEAIEKLLDRKLGLLNCFLQQLHPDLGTFKELVRVEFEGMGLRLREHKVRQPPLSNLWKLFRRWAN